MSTLRRYEILVPLVFNDSRPVPEEALAETFAELRDHFGAASWETQVLRGAWGQAGTVYQDNLTRLFVDVAEKPFRAVNLVHDNAADCRQIFGP